MHRAQPSSHCLDVFRIRIACVVRLLPADGYRPHQGDRPAPLLGGTWPQIDFQQMPGKLMLWS
jgi:hypothetical protein